MEFPIKLEMGFIVDLRYIPFLLVALYGGYKYTFSLYIVLNVYRFIIGGQGIFRSLIFSTVIYILVPFLNRIFVKQNSRKRISTAVCVSFFTIVIYLISLATVVPELNYEYWSLTVYTLSTYVLVMLVIMILIERIIENKKTREAIIQSERFNVISDLSASVSHEIRNPLTVTSGFLQLLNGSKTITVEEKRYMGIKGLFTQGKWN
jgi:two-component system sporulation sensor kinase B